MLFFQVFLLLGYLYAHLLDRLPRTRLTGILHLSLLLLAVFLLPILPDPGWKPVDSSKPQWRILLLLTVSVGLPYLLLAATGPLVQAWYSRALDGRSPYHFYAVSNCGALAALLSYPFWIEPAFDVPDQGVLWSSGYRAFAIISGALAIAAVRWNLPLAAVEKHSQTAGEASSVPSVWRCFFWLALSAFGAMGLLALTDHICQDVAVVPFLWVAPLSLYLITFIVCFHSDMWYRPNLFSGLTLSVLLLIAGVSFRENLQPAIDRVNWLLEPVGLSGEIPHFLDNIALEATLYLSVLFCVCMLCHGELVRSKPAPRHVTLFYLCMAAGGALGGLFVAMLCPRIFASYVETVLFLVGGALLAIVVLMDSWVRRERRWRRWWRQLARLSVSVVRGWVHIRPRHNPGERPARRNHVRTLVFAVRRGRPWYTFGNLLVPLSLLAGVAAFAWVAEWPNRTALVSRRSFYGTLRVTEHGVGGSEERRGLYHGRILHGIQFMAPGRRREPTSYYSPESGIGLTLTKHRDKEPLRVATVGLGTGTIAAYGTKGDYYCFYEINPDVIDIARKYFTFLGDSPATIRVKEGDARLSMEQERPRHYDIIALDAFSGDAIPAHLLTVEAMAVYLKHLNTDGVLAVHTSNRHLDLVPIVALLAAHYEMEARVVEVEDDGGVADAGSQWLLLSNNDRLLRALEAETDCEPLSRPDPDIRVWSDHYSNLFQILRAW